MQRQQAGGPGAQTAFVYSAEPQAVPSKRGTRSKYRKEEPTPEQAWVDENDLLASNNIMYDRRVVRGNTYAAQVITQSAQKEAERMRADHERRMRTEALRRRQEAERALMPRTPPAVDGRTHMDVQTDDFLEELTDRPVESDVMTQTEAFLDRPPSPLFVPAKSGVDAHTQVEVRELFNFDLEVEPILEVLVGKTLELSMLEVMEEEELLAIRRRQQHFTEQRDAELAEVQRMEAEAKRKFAEKQRRLKQQQEAKKSREALLEKVAARCFAKNYLASLNGDVFDGLQEDGHFFDPLQREVSEVFVPWLLDEVCGQVSRAVQGQQALDSLIQSAVQRAGTEYERAVQEKKDELVRQVAERAEAARRKAEEDRLAAEAAAAKAAQDAAEGAPTEEEDS